MRAILLVLLTAAAVPALGQTAPKPVTTMLKPVEKIQDGTQPRQRFVTVFGVDKCPAPSSPDEIVVCTHLPEEQQFRIPKQLRGANNARVSAYEYNRNLLLGSGAGGAGGGVGSCSVNGPGGYIGCNRKQVDAWAADRAARMGHDEVVPPQ